MMIAHACLRAEDKNIYAVNEIAFENNHSEDDDVGGLIDERRDDDVNYDTASHERGGVAVQERGEGVNMGELRALIEEMSKLKQGFDRKWEKLAQLSHVHNIIENNARDPPAPEPQRNNDFIRITQLSDNNNSQQNNNSPHLDIPDDCLRLTAPQQEGRYKDENRRNRLLSDKRLSCCLNATIAAPPIQVFKTMDGCLTTKNYRDDGRIRRPSFNATLIGAASTTSTQNFLVRDQLILQLQQTKRVIQRDEKLKRKLILKLREMNEELQQLRVYKELYYQCTLEAYTYPNDGQELSPDMYQNAAVPYNSKTSNIDRIGISHEQQQQESELIHFAATAGNNEDSPNKIGQENVEDSQLNVAYQETPTQPEHQQPLVEGVCHFQDVDAEYSLREEMAQNNNSRSKRLTALRAPSAENYFDPTHLASQDHESNANQRITTTDLSRASDIKTPGRHMWNNDDDNSQIQNVSQIESANLMSDAKPRKPLRSPNQQIRDTEVVSLKKQPKANGKIKTARLSYPQLLSLNEKEDSSQQQKNSQAASAPCKTTQIRGSTRNNSGQRIQQILLDQVRIQNKKFLAYDQNAAVSVTTGSLSQLHSPQSLNNQSLQNTNMQYQQSNQEDSSTPHSYHQLQEQCMKPIIGSSFQYIQSAKIINKAAQNAKQHSSGLNNTSNLQKYQTLTNPSKQLLEKLSPKIQYSNGLYEEVNCRDFVIDKENGSEIIIDSPIPQKLQPEKLLVVEQQTAHSRKKSKIGEANCTMVEILEELDHPSSSYMTHQIKEPLLGSPQLLLGGISKLKSPILKPLCKNETSTERLSINVTCTKIPKLSNANSLLTKRQSVGGQERNNSVKKQKSLLVQQQIQLSAKKAKNAEKKNTSDSARNESAQKSKKCSLLHRQSTARQSKESNHDIMSAISRPSLSQAVQQLQKQTSITIHGNEVLCASKKPELLSMESIKSGKNAPQTARALQNTSRPSSHNMFISPRSHLMQPTVLSKKGESHAKQSPSITHQSIIHSKRQKPQEL